MLPDKELIRLAAERIMGWPVLCLDDPDREVEIWPCLYETNDGAGWVVMTGPEPQTDQRDWDPLTDWRAAGEIIARMQEFGWQCTLTLNVCGSSKARCAFRPLTIPAVIWPGRPYQESSPVQGDTGPRAIVLAALYFLRAATAVEVIP